MGEDPSPHRDGAGHRPHPGREGDLGVVEATPGLQADPGARDEAGEGEEVPVHGEAEVGVPQQRPGEEGQGSEGEEAAGRSMAGAVGMNSNPGLRNRLRCAEK